MELTRTLRTALQAEHADPATALGRAPADRLSQALRAYEVSRSHRTSGLVKKAWALGAAGQIAFPPVRACPASAAPCKLLLPAVLPHSVRMRPGSRVCR